MCGLKNAIWAAEIWATLHLSREGKDQVRTSSQGLLVSLSIVDCSELFSFCKLTASLPNSNPFLVPTIRADRHKQSCLQKPESPSCKNHIKNAACKVQLHKHSCAASWGSEGEGGHPEELRATRTNPPSNISGWIIKDSTARPEDPLALGGLLEFIWFSFAWKEKFARPNTPLVWTRRHWVGKRGLFTSKVLFWSELKCSCRSTKVYFHFTSSPRILNKVDELPVLLAMDIFIWSNIMERKKGSFGVSSNFSNQILVCNLNNVLQ